MGEMLRINGGNILSGRINVGGAKNSLVALIPASIITKSIVKLENVKPIDDTYTLINILNKLNVKTLYDGKSCLYIDSRNIKNCVLDSDDVMKMRASYYFMGALLSLYNKVDILGPGGCNFTERPIDLHLYAFECLGVECGVNKGMYNLKKKGKKRNIDFTKKSMGATINAILASCRGKGKVVISNCSIEPEIDDLINFLNKCGCNIIRREEQIIVEGVEDLHGCEYRVMFDRIEAGTFMIIGGLVGNNLEVKNVDCKCMRTLIDCLEKIGVNVVEGKNSVVISRSDGYRPIDVVVAPYPGFPTDLQQPFSVLLSMCDGISSIRETVYPARISHVESLNKMNALISVEGDLISVSGKRDLKCGTVSGKDLRGGISLVLAALVAKGESFISGVKYIKRGYSELVEKLKKVGADIHIERCLDDE